MDSNGHLISLQQTAALLDVSDATVRNWVKHGYLSVATNSKAKFYHDAVIELQNRIERGEIDRLRKRANKKKANNSFIPDEYLIDNSFVDEIERIRAYFSDKSLDLAVAIFVLSLKQLVLSGEVQLSSSVQECKACFAELKPSPFDYRIFSDWRRDCVKAEIEAWRVELGTTNDNQSGRRDNHVYWGLFDLLTDVSHADTIGIIYQSLMSVGNKARKGSYYTPKTLIEGILNDHQNKHGLFLDPCCGTGQFLLCAAQVGYHDPSALYGFDLDPLAVRIARLNLLLFYRDDEFSPNIYQADSLRDVDYHASSPDKPHQIQHRFDLIATNPPWGASYQKDEIKRFKRLYPMLDSGESFSYFLAKSLELVSEGGYISFVLPESILNIRAHVDIRSHILHLATIEKITCFGRKFKGVFTPVIRLDLLKCVTDDWRVEIKTTEGRTYHVPQARFVSNPYCIFDVYLTDEENQIIEQLYALPHVTLQGTSNWALGIVTGDNQKYLDDTWHDGLEPIYRGRDVDAYRLKQPSTFIRYRPERFQQVAPEAKYRAKEKLIYRFISNRLVFAYDNQQSLTLNSANILIPQIENYPLKLILGLLNSRLYQFVFRKKFNTHKVLRGDLEMLPLPLMSNSAQHAIIQLVNQALNGHHVETELDKLIMKICRLSTRQVEIIRNMDR
ncbi:TaqI-like C-terminal specificity domain-containing protein [Anaerolineales bacterium HSG24]|nr:TaqI-like C-terminal specificity domain-containing protein [Anaerolineales bacterium HSG24]